jgi:DNA-directed RNA polymerase beta subunit
MQTLQDLISPHVESFNFALERGLQYALEEIRPHEMVDPKGRRMVMALEGATIGYPTVDEKNVFSKSVQVFPSECRERATTYKAKLSLTLKWELDGKSGGSITKVVGQVPIMVKVCLNLKWELCSVLVIPNISSQRTADFGDFPLKISSSIMRRHRSGEGTLSSMATRG